MRVQPEPPRTLLDTVSDHPYLAGGAALGTAGLAAGALAARRALGLRGAYTSKYNAIPIAETKDLLRKLRPGDIIVNSTPTSALKFDPNASPLRRMGSRIMAHLQEAVHGDARHASIYTGKGKVVHMMPAWGGLVDSPVEHVLEPGSSVLRPNLPKKVRATAARKAKNTLKKPMKYDWKNMPRVAANRLAPVSCLPGDERTCSGLIADIYHGNTLVSDMPDKLVAPADLVASDHVIPLGRLAPSLTKTSAPRYHHGAVVAAAHLGVDL